MAVTHIFSHIENANENEESSIETYLEKIKETLVKNMRRTNTEIKSFEDCIECVYEDDEGYTVIDVPMYD